MISLVERGYAMALLGALDELIVAYKHLQGKHDQRTHAGSRTAVYGGIEYAEHEPDSTILPGFSDLAVERVADFIWNRGIEPEFADEVLDKAVLGNQTLGEWADDVLSKVRSKRLVDGSEGVLDESDLQNLKKFDKSIWRVERELRIVSDKRMPEYNIEHAEAEYGKSRYSLWPDVKPVGTWKFENKKFVISVNADAEKVFGVSKRSVFWHEFGHTITEDQIVKVMGSPLSGESAADYMNRFASRMSD